MDSATLNGTFVQEKGLGFGDLSVEQAQRAIDVMTGRITEELTDEELELVAAGFFAFEPGFAGGIFLAPREKNLTATGTNANGFILNVGTTEN